MTVADLKKKHSSRPHNPILASAFFKGGLIETWGRGTSKIVDEVNNLIDYGSFNVVKNRINRNDLKEK